MAIKETTLSDLRELPWATIIALGAFSLLRPILSIVGAYDDGPLKKPVGPLILTALIIVVWIGTAVVRRFPRPVESLAFVGVAYGVLALLLNLSLQPFLDDAEVPPVPGMIGILVFNAAQGAVCGLIALALLRWRSRSGRA
ncbi:MULTISPECIES: hypothetical protein [Streptomyces]|uniref:Uncharacterized protein n=1 Tax=Streptomyces acidicola TaxID=2596892 RepID=A0A5N8WQB5_9ACTN|nr:MULTISPECIES: hypothetical protein [Streptomyces]MBA2811357.1 hypothetical protein [Streptomyces sp. KM273126]MPY49352.1 hypothetical protein [Streptomyces acidicola]